MRSVTYAMPAMKMRTISCSDVSSRRSSGLPWVFCCPQTLTVRELHKIPRPSHVPGDHFDSFVILTCWQLWKRRNGVVFRSEVTTRQQTLQVSREEARLWRCRMPRSAADICDTWCSIFTNAMYNNNNIAFFPK